MNIQTDIKPEARDLTVMRQFSPAIFGDSQKVEDLLASLEAEVRATKIDISTREGREACAALAYKVARSKTFLDEQGKTLVSGLKAQVNLVDAERRKIRDRCDALKDEVRAPLDAYENAERERIANHENGITHMRGLATLPENTSSPWNASAAVLRDRKEELGTFYRSRAWEEFAARAAETFELGDLRLANHIHVTEIAEEREQQRMREELERLAKERQERDRRIAEEAAEEATRKAQREIEAALNRQRRLDEIRRQEQEERIATAERAKKRAEEATAAANEEAKRLAEQAEKRAQLAAEAAVKAERDRVNLKLARENQERERAERNKKNRAIKHNQIAEALRSNVGISKETAHAVVEAIAKGAISHVNITY